MDRFMGPVHIKLFFKQGIHGAVQAERETGRPGYTQFSI
jgi:hypothetical protein